MHFVNIEYSCCRLRLSKVVIVNKTKLQKQFQLFLYVHHKNESRIRRSPEAACYTYIISQKHFFISLIININNTCMMC